MWAFAIGRRVAGFIGTQNICVYFLANVQGSNSLMALKDGVLFGKKVIFIVSMIDVTLIINLVTLCKTAC